MSTDTKSQAILYKKEEYMPLLEKAINFPEKHRNKVHCVYPYISDNKEKLGIRDLSLHKDISIAKRTHIQKGNGVSAWDTATYAKFETPNGKEYNVWVDGRSLELNYVDFLVNHDGWPEHLAKKRSYYNFSQPTFQYDIEENRIENGETIRYGLETPYILGVAIICMDNGEHGYYAIPLLSKEIRTAHTDVVFVESVALLNCVSFMLSLRDAGHMDIDYSISRFLTSFHDNKYYILYYKPQSLYNTKSMHIVNMNDIIDVKAKPNGYVSPWDWF